MRVLLVAIALVLAAPVRARADDAVGVVVTGDPAMQPEVVKHLERWLKKHGHHVVASPLSPDATNTIVNCFVVDDPKCARAVVEAKASAGTLIFTRVDVAKKDITFTSYWFVKGHEPVGERRVCESCTATSWEPLVDTMLQILAGSSSTALGKLDLRSKPAGMTVLLDNNVVGVTPLERDVPAGPHSIKLQHDGKNVGEKDVTITSGETSHVVMRVKDPAVAVVTTTTHPSRLFPAILAGSGIVAMGAGATMLYYGYGTSNVKYVYPDLVAPGIGMIALGLGATIGGVVLLSQSGSHTVPVVSIGPDSTYLGVVGRF